MCLGRHWQRRRSRRRLRRAPPPRSARGWRWRTAMCRWLRVPWPQRAAASPQRCFVSQRQHSARRVVPFSFLSLHVLTVHLHHRCAGAWCVRCGWRAAAQRVCVASCATRRRSGAAWSARLQTPSGAPTATPSMPRAARRSSSRRSGSSSASTFCSPRRSSTPTSWPQKQAQRPSCRPSSRQQRSPMAQLCRWRRMRRRRRWLLMCARVPRRRRTRRLLRLRRSMRRCRGARLSLRLRPLLRLRSL